MRKHQDLYSGQIVKQADGAYDVVIPKLIAPPKPYNPMIVDNIRNVETVLEQPLTAPVNRPVYKEPSFHGLTLNEYGMEFADYDKHMERTLRSIQLTSEELSALRTIPNISFRGIPLDHTSRRYCQKDEVQFDLLVSGTVRTRFQCLKPNEVVPTLLSHFQIRPAVPLVNPVPTGFGSSTVSTPYMAMMTENPQRPTNYPNMPTFGLATPGTDLTNLQNLLKEKNLKLQAQSPIQNPIQAPSQTLTQAPAVKLSLEPATRTHLNAAYVDWLQKSGRFYAEVPDGISSFQKIVGQRFALTMFTQKARALTDAMASTMELMSTLKDIAPESKELPNFRNNNWLPSEIPPNLKEFKGKLAAFHLYLAKLFDDIKSVYKPLREAVRKAFENVLDACTSEGAACLRYLDEKNAPILGLAFGDALEIMRSYTCNVMHSITTNAIQIDPTTACRMEHKFATIGDVLHFLGGQAQAEALNEIQFCRMLLQGLSKTVTDTSKLMYTLEETKSMIKSDFGLAYSHIVSIVTDTQVSKSSFDAILQLRKPTVDLANFMVLCLLLELCGVVPIAKIKEWLLNNTEPVKPGLLKPDERIPSGFLQRLGQFFGSVRTG